MLLSSMFSIVSLSQKRFCQSLIFLILFKKHTFLINNHHPQSFSPFMSFSEKQTGEAYRDSIGTEKQQTRGSHSLVLTNTNYKHANNTHSQTFQTKHLIAGDKCAVISHRNLNICQHALRLGF